MKYPNSFHITTVFRGSKGFNKNLKSVQEFSLGKEVEFQPLAGVFVLRKMVGDLKPIQSNEILENLFCKNMPLNEEYISIIDGKKNDYTIYKR